MSKKFNLASTSNLTIGQIVILLRNRKTACLVSGVLLALASAVYGLLEVPTFTSVSKIQFKTFNVGKNISITNLTEADTSERDEILDKSIAVTSSDVFHEELAKKLKENEAGLVLSWGIGKRDRVNSALARFGFDSLPTVSVNIASLGQGDLAQILGKMIETSVDYKNKAATVKITALVPKTAQRVNYLVTNAIISTNQKIRGEETSKSIEFIQTQLSQARKKLVESNENLQLFYMENPNLLDSGGRNTQLDDQREMQRKKERITDDLASNKKLLEFYKEKFVSFSSNSDSSAEVFNKFKQELVELKYKKKKFIFDGYDEANEGIVDINNKIKNIERILAGTSFKEIGVTGNSLVGVGHEKSVSEKIMELQDQIKKEQFELELVSAREQKVSPKVSDASKSMLLLENLKIEVRLASSIFEDLSRRLEYSQIQANDSRSNQGEISESPSLPSKSNALSIYPRCFFGFVVGCFLAFSYFIISMLFSMKITDSQSVEDMGVNFIGTLRNFDPDLTEVLSNIDCLDRDYSETTPIVLCACPEASVSYQSIFLLTGFLAKQKEKSLFILLGSVNLPNRFRLISDLGVAQVYSHGNEREYVLKITDKKTIKSLKETIQILEVSYKMKFSAVFLFFIRGINDPNYHVGVKVATKILMLGIPARFSSTDYMKLMQGSKDMSVSNFAFVDARAFQIKPSKSQKTGSSFVHSEIAEVYKEESKLRDIFFDKT